MKNKKTISEIRCDLRKIRNGFDRSVVSDASFVINKMVIPHEIFNKSQKISAYLAFDMEVDLSLLINKIIELDKKCYLPIVKGKKMFFANYTTSKIDDLIENKYGILEPVFDEKKTIDPKDLDLAIVPILGFDSFANRIGFGGGFYDRTFHFKKYIKKKPILIGVAYEAQKLQSFPLNYWDIQMDMIFTEKRVYCADFKS